MESRSDRRPERPAARPGPAGARYAPIAGRPRRRRPGGWQQPIAGPARAGRAAARRAGAARVGGRAASTGSILLIPVVVADRAGRGRSALEQRRRRGSSAAIVSRARVPGRGRCSLRPAADGARGRAQRPDAGASRSSASAWCATPASRSTSAAAFLREVVVKGLLFGFVGGSFFSHPDAARLPLAALGRREPLPARHGRARRHVVQLSSRRRRARSALGAAGPDHLVAAGPDADQHDRDAEEVGDEVEVGLRGRRAGRRSSGTPVMSSCQPGQLHRGRPCTLCRIDWW